MGSVYGTLPQHWPGNAWCEAVSAQAEEALRAHPHGDLPRWRSALEALPATEPAAILDRDAPELGGPAADPQGLLDTLMRLHPWRKGPLRLGGVFIDSEWRSDWKWRRVSPHVDLDGRRILDIGCGNGYYGLRMLAEGNGWPAGISAAICPISCFRWVPRRCRRGAPGSMRSFPWGCSITVATLLSTCA